MEVRKSEMPYDQPNKNIKQSINFAKTEKKQSTYYSKTQVHQINTILKIKIKIKQNKKYKHNKRSKTK